MSKREIDHLTKELGQACSYDQWQEIAKRCDELEGSDDWRAIDRSNLYDYRAIRSRLDKLKTLRTKGDDHGLLFALNEGIHGNMGGMGRSALYSKSRIGTKNLIVSYVDEVCSALNHLASPMVDSISIEEKLEFFHRASHCFGRTALMLSGSGSLLYFHLGVVRALSEQDLLPSVISGASGGAIVAAIVGTHSRDELEKIFDPEYIKFEVEQEIGAIVKGSFFRRGQVPVKVLEQFFERLIPDLTFQEASQLTGIHTNVSVAAAEKHQSSRLLNDIASPNVMLREALLASSAFPGFYPPVTLAAKNLNGVRTPYLPQRKWIDGSVSDDVPIRRVMRLYGVNHTIVSQTNPAALPFITDGESNGSWGLVKKTLRNTTKEWSLLGAKLIDRPLSISPTISQLLSLTSAALSQTYTGDINILPPRRLHNPLSLLAGRSRDEIIELIRHGERATWPKIEAIRIQTKVSRTLDSIVRDLELDLLKRAEGSEKMVVNAR